MITKPFILLGTLLFSMTAALAGEKTVTPSQGVRLTGLRASHTFKVTLHQSDDASRNGVRITLDERLEPYLKAEVSGGILRLGFEELPKELQNTEKWSCPATAEVTLSRIDRLAVSGMASIHTDDTFSGTASQIDASGMGRIDPITIAVTGNGTPEIGVSGMGRIDVTLRNPVAGMGIDASGMSRLRLTHDAKSNNTKINASGKGEVDLTLQETGSMTLHASGMATITASGQTERLEARSSGQARLELGDLNSAEVDCNASGMSHIVCRVTESIDASASGKSSIRVAADRAIRINTQTTAMAKVRLDTAEIHLK